MCVPTEWSKTEKWVRQQVLLEVLQFEWLTYVNRFQVNQYKFWRAHSQDLLSRHKKIKYTLLVELVE